MNAMISKLLQDIFSARPDFANDGKLKEAGNFGEADSYLYGDGMGWTSLMTSLSCDEEQELKPACCLK